MHIKVAKKNDGLPIPQKATPGSVGFDLMASLAQKKFVSLRPGQIQLIPTGIFLCFPDSVFAMVCSRSGLALKNGVFVLNSPGIIDSDYRGEIGVILANFGNEDFEVHHGMRIAQLIFFNVYNFDLDFVATVHDKETKFLFEDDLDKNLLREDGGFGSTGK